MLLLVSLAVYGQWVVTGVVATRRTRWRHRARHPWFALGFALYSVASAAVGTLASEQQNAETAAQPMTYTLLDV